MVLPIYSSQLSFTLTQIMHLNRVRGFRSLKNYRGECAPVSENDSRTQYMKNDYRYHKEKKKKNFILLFCKARWFRRTPKQVKVEK